MSQSYARLEAVARSLEVDFGEALTLGRHSHAVAAHLRRVGPERGRRPRIISLSGCAALGHDLRRPGPRRAVGRRPAGDPRDGSSRTWAAPGDVAAALAKSGLRIAAGDGAGVVVVKTAEGAVAGALDRLAGTPRAAVRERLEAEMA